jgi:hypothetical protein
MYTAIATAKKRGKKKTFCGKANENEAFEIDAAKFWRGRG